MVAGRLLGWRLARMLIEAGGPVLAARGAPGPATGAWWPPGEAPVRRVLARIDPDALDQVIGRWLTDQ